MTGVRIIGLDVEPDFSSPGPILSHINEQDYRLRIDTRLHEFGDTIVVFGDTRAFIERLNRAADDSGFFGRLKAVDYVDETYCGDLGVFRKIERFRYQNESRFVTNDPIEGPMTLTLGSLSDLALMFNLTELKDSKGSLGQERR